MRCTSALMNCDSSCQVPLLLPSSVGRFSVLMPHLPLSSLMTMLIVLRLTDQLTNGVCLQKKIGYRVPHLFFFLLFFLCLILVPFLPSVILSLGVGVSFFFSLFSSLLSLSFFWLSFSISFHVQQDKPSVNTSGEIRLYHRVTHCYAHSLTLIVFGCVCVFLLR